MSKDGSVSKRKLIIKRIAMALLVYVVSYVFMRHYLYTWPGQPDYPRILEENGHRPMIVMQYYSDIDAFNKFCYVLYWPAASIDSALRPKYVVYTGYWDAEDGEKFDRWAEHEYMKTSPGL